MVIPNYIMLHHTAVSIKKNPDQFLATNRYHKQKWGIKSMLGFYGGYHYEISAQGMVRQTRKEGERAVACWQRGMNDGRCIHICLDGNFDEEQPLPAQVFALRDLLRKICKTYAIPKKNVLFHSDFAKKTCPGKKFSRTFVISLLS